MICQRYIVELDVIQEVELLRRIRILHAAMYRILDTKGVTLRRVKSVDHEAGHMELDIYAPRADPSIVPGTVTAKFREA